jgi:hypothetical protein
VNEVELQLSGLKFCDGSGTSVHIVDKMPLMQRRLAEMVMTLPGTTVAEEFCRRCLLQLPAEEGGGCCPTTREAVYAKGESDVGEGDRPTAGSRRGREASVE